MDVFILVKITNSRCLHEESFKTIHSLVGSIEQEFDSILANEEYWRYREILDKYSGIFDISRALKNSLNEK